ASSAARSSILRRRGDGRALVTDARRLEHDPADATATSAAATAARRDLAAAPTGRDEKAALAAAAAGAVLCRRGARRSKRGTRAALAVLALHRDAAALATRATVGAYARCKA